MKKIQVIKSNAKHKIIYLCPLCSFMFNYYLCATTKAQFKNGSDERHTGKFLARTIWLEGIIAEVMPLSRQLPLMSTCAFLLRGVDLRRGWGGGRKQPQNTSICSIIQQEKIQWQETLRYAHWLKQLFYHSLASGLPPTLKLVQGTYASRTDCQCCLASLQSCLECSPHSQTACVCFVTSSLMTAAYYSLLPRTGFHDRLAILVKVAFVAVCGFIHTCHDSLGRRRKLLVFCPQLDKLIGLLPAGVTFAT